MNPLNIIRTATTRQFILMMLATSAVGFIGGVLWSVVRA